MDIFRMKVAAGALAGVLSLAATGAAALAAFEPSQPATAAAIRTDGAAETAAAERDGDDKDDKKALAGLNGILERLVRNGTITAEQKSKIIEAARGAAKRDERPLKEILAALTRLSVQHLGVTKEAAGQALRAGTSLGQLADATPGKSRAGLITFLVGEVTAKVDQALASDKITQEQADRFTADVTERVTTFVDHVAKKKAARPEKERTEKERAERGKPGKTKPRG